MQRNREPLPRVSQRKRGAPRVARRTFQDSRGVAFEDHRFLLPACTADWPKTVRVVDPAVCKLMHERFWCCWECEVAHVQAHHIAAGSRGKSDELTAIVMVCGLHHGQLSAPILPLGRLLFLKWRMDRVNLDWLRVALLLGRFLPDLITD